MSHGLWLILYHHASRSATANPTVLHAICTVTPSEMVVPTGTVTGADVAGGEGVGAGTGAGFGAGGDAGAGAVEPAPESPGIVQPRQWKVDADRDRIVNSTTRGSLLIPP